MTKFFISSLNLLGFALSFGLSSNVLANCDRVADEQSAASALATPSARADAYRQLVGRCPQFNTHYNAGRAILSAGDPAGAIVQFKAARSVAGDSKAKAAAAMRLAEAELEAGRLPEAMAALAAARQDAGNALPPWALDIAKRVDSHPGRERVSAADIAAIMGSSRSYGVRPRVDLRIGFDYDKDTLDVQGRAQVAELAKLLASMPAGTQFRFIGHSDARGDASYNQNLSERRAQSVRLALIDSSPDWASRLRAEGRGKRELLYPGDSEDDHRLNRRVEIVQE